MSVFVKVNLFTSFQDRNLEWFPRLRAMSLSADEGEGEQMELRTLQLQLEKTQNLVSILSQQLTELKDQVSEFVYKSYKIILHFLVMESFYVLELIYM